MVCIRLVEDYEGVVGLARPCLTMSKIVHSMTLCVLSYLSITISRCIVFDTFQSIGIAKTRKSLLSGYQESRARHILVSMSDLHCLDLLNLADFFKFFHLSGLRATAFLCHRLDVCFLTSFLHANVDAVVVRRNPL